MNVEIKLRTEFRTAAVRLGDFDDPTEWPGHQLTDSSCPCITGLSIIPSRAEIRRRWADIGGGPYVQRGGAETRAQLADSGQLSSHSRPQFPRLYSEEVDLRTKRNQTKPSPFSSSILQAYSFGRGDSDTESTTLNHVQTTGTQIRKAGSEPPSRLSWVRSFIP